MFLKQAKQHKFFLKCLCACLLLTYGNFAFAALSINLSNVSAQTMLATIAEQVPQFMRLVTAFAYVLGFVFVIQGIIKLKHFGESRTMMSQEHHLKGPLTLLIIGTLLIYLPSTVHVSLSTFWTNPNPYAYLSQEKDQWNSFLNTCFLIVQLIGTISFVRGLLVLNQLGGHAQPHTFGKGMTQVIAGIFCINIYQFIEVVFATMGLK